MVGNFLKKKGNHRKSIAFLSLLLLVSIAAAITTFIVAVAGGKNDNWINGAMIVVGGVLLIMAVLYACNVIAPLIFIERRLWTDRKRRDTVNKKVKKRANTDHYFNVFDDILDIIDERKSDMSGEFALAMASKQNELRALQNQINPHFLYNTLDCIRGMAVEQGADNVEEMTRALSEMFRYSISRKGKSSVRFEEEIANVDNYLLIQQNRFRNKINVKKNTEPAVKKCYMPKMLMQPIIENAVFHGLEPKTGSRNLYIEAYCTDKRLVIKVEDDGVGMPLTKLNMINDALRDCVSINENDRNTQIGLANVNERLQLLYGSESGLHVFSCPNVGTTVEIVMPIILEPLQ